MLFWSDIENQSVCVSNLRECYTYCVVYEAYHLYKANGGYQAHDFDDDYEDYNDYKFDNLYDTLYTG